MFFCVTLELFLSLSSDCLKSFLGGCATCMSNACSSMEMRDNCDPILRGRRQKNCPHWQPWFKSAQVTPERSNLTLKMGLEEERSKTVVQLWASGPKIGVHQLRPQTQPLHPLKAAESSFHSHYKRTM